jgi:hypothetical protein
MDKGDLMAQIQITIHNKTHYIGRYQSPDDYDVLDGKFYRERSADYCIKVAETLRAAGRDSARAVTNLGESLVREPAITAENAQPVADERPETFRGVTPVRVGGRYFIKWTDAVTGQQFQISGNTAQHALESLFTTEHPAVHRFIATLPENNPAPPAAAPVQAQTASAVETRVLRPGDNYQTLPPREMLKAPVIREDFAAWEQNASVAQLKERVKRDGEFARWYENQQAVPISQKG